MSEYEPNGCGPWWYPRIWKDRYFEDECKVHDQNYFEGNDRIKADMEFLESMLRKAEGNRVRILQAYIFFGIVLLLGWTSHRKGLDL